MDLNFDALLCLCIFFWISMFNLLKQFESNVFFPSYNGLDTLYKVDIQTLHHQILHSYILILYGLDNPHLF